MEEIKINHSFWKTLLLAIGCLEVFAMMIHMTEDLSTYTIQGLLFIFLCISAFGLGGLYLLSVMIKERLLHQPFIRISQNVLLIVNRLLRKKVINFRDMLSKFQCSGDDSIYISLIDTNAQELCTLLNKY